MPPRKKERTAALQMLLCACLWSIAGIFIKLIDWNPFAIAGARSLIAAVTVFCYLRFKKHNIVVTSRSLSVMFFLCATFLCFVSANKLTTAANAIVLQYTAPIFIMLYSVLFLRQKFGFSDVLTVLATFFGISIFFVESLRQGQWLGNLIAVFAGIFLAGTFLSVGRSDEDEKMSGIFFGQLLTAAIGLPFCFFTRVNISAVSLSAILILGVFQLGIPYILMGLAASYCPPLACSLIGAAEPLLNPLWVFLFNGERPGLFSLVGGVIVISAVTAHCIIQDRKAAGQVQAAGT
jgi:drug/metabolite transporter (DMT)-like permease